MAIPTTPKTILDPMGNPFLEDALLPEATANAEEITLRMAKARAANPWYPVRTPEEEVRLRARQAKGLSPDGRKKGGRKKRGIEEKDWALLRFLATALVASKWQAAHLLSCHPVTASKRLWELEAMGLVSSQSQTRDDPGAHGQRAGSLLFYSLSHLGLRTLRKEGRIPDGEGRAWKKDTFPWPRLAHTLACSSFIADAITRPGGPSIEAFRSERFIQSAWKMTGWKDEARMERRQGAFNSYRLKAIHHRGEGAARDALRAWYPQLWSTAAPIDRIGGTAFHDPDLALVLGPNRAVAVEIEISHKGMRDLREVLACYAGAGWLGYSEVLYATHDPKIEAKVREAARLEGFPMERLSFRPLLRMGSNQLAAPRQMAYTAK